MRMLLRGAAMLAAVVTVASLTSGATAQSRTGRAAETAGAVQTSAAAQIPPGVTAACGRLRPPDRHIHRTGQRERAVPVRLGRQAPADPGLPLGPRARLHHPPADRARLEPMLRGSDDDAANHYWSTYGGSEIINRMTARPALGLRDTAPPPAEYADFWGYTALSARDTVSIYRYILEKAPAPSVTSSWTTCAAPLAAPPPTTSTSTSASPVRSTVRGR